VSFATSRIESCYCTLQADATVLSTLVVLQHVVSAGGREKHRPTVHVVGMVRRPSTVEVANYLVGELLS
jgi:hypothetical protein